MRTCREKKMCIDAISRATVSIILTQPEKKNERDENNVCLPIDHTDSHNF